jgi:hypothetical protein
VNVSATRLAAVFAASFYAAGLIGFIPNPMVGPTGVFAANWAHNVFHILTAVGLTVVALAGRRPSTIFMLAFGPTYALIGLLGFAVTGNHSSGHLLGLIHLNTPDNFLHIGLGALVGVAGWLVRDQIGSRPVLAA